MFPKSSPSFQVVLYNVPSSTSFVHMICPKFNSHMYKLKRKAVGECICFYFAMGSKEMLPLRKVLMFQKIVDRLMNKIFSQFFLNYEHP